MPKNEDGEFELVLGNRQLLSVFFIVVVLLGVFFTMGYVVGKNSSPAVSADSGRRPEPKPVEEHPATPGNSPVQTAETSPPPPVQRESQPAPAPAPERTQTHPARPPAEKPAPKPPPDKPESASPTPDVPTPGGSYLQVAAVAKAEAELFVDVLAKKGFHALYTPVPDKAAIYRVLVGPFQDSGAIAQARADLNKAGFKGYEAFVRKY